MNEQINEQTTVQTHTVDTDSNLGEDKMEVSLGKFKDVSALKSAYDSLQAEFTKRCQRIKELEDSLKADKEKSPAESDKGIELKGMSTGITQAEKEEILKGYLKDLLLAKQQAIVMDNSGIGLKAPVEKPKTIEQASIFAKEIFNN